MATSLCKHALGNEPVFETLHLNATKSKGEERRSKGNKGGKTNLPVANTYVNSQLTTAVIL